jgi:hypothetical protein
LWAKHSVEPKTSTPPYKHIEEAYSLISAVEALVSADKIVGVGTGMCELLFVSVLEVGLQMQKLLMIEVKQSLLFTMPLSHYSQKFY